MRALASSIGHPSGYGCRPLRAAAALVALLGCSALALADGFGRFGYGGEPPIARFELDRKGFRVRHPLADKLAFESQVPQLRPILTNEYSQTLFLGGAGITPQKAKIDLFGEGFGLFYENGFSFKLQSLVPPYLTWFEGSVGHGVPTPKVRWVLLSFRDEQPPILLGFPGEPCAMVLVGGAGDWRLKSTAPYTGWVRVVAPIGAEPFKTISASDLGRLSNRIKGDAPYYAQVVPRLVSTSIEEDLNGVTATWRFDAPGALLPIPLLLAPLGGYPLRATGEQRRLQIRDAYGPVTVAASNQIAVRFPVRRVPTGRCLAIGDAVWSPPATVSTIDAPSIVELAIANLGSQRDPSAKATAESALDDFLRTTAYQEEPATRQSLPYAASGKGTDIAAAFALLMQCAMNAEKATSEPNSLLTSVIWRRDWYTWRVWATDPKVGRRAGALAAIAAALCPEKERRMEAGMLQAGLAAERGLLQWAKANGVRLEAPPLIEPLEPLRNALFAMAGHPAAQDAFLKMLQSEVRVYGELSVSAEKGPDAFALKFSVPEATRRTLVLSSAYPLTVAAGTNIASVEAQEVLGFTLIKYTPKAPGKCELWVTCPDWAAPLPGALPLMHYEEPLR